MALEDTVRAQAVVISQQALTIKAQAETMKDQQCRIEILQIENTRLREGLALLHAQVVALGQRPAFEK
jgi:hypothetical protein